LSKRLLVERLLEVAERRGLLLLQLARSGTLARARKGWGRWPSCILETDDAVELRTRRVNVVRVLVG
jgi:hypothetical protein